MDKKDWYDCGARIGELVQSAIDSKNFQALNETIINTVNDTMNSVTKGLGGIPNGGTGRNKGPADGSSPYSGRGNTTYRGGGKAYHQAKEQARTGDLFDRIRSEVAGTPYTEKQKKLRFGMKGILSEVIGFTGAFFMGIGTLGFLVMNGLSFGAVAGLAITAALAWLGFKGWSYRKRLKRLEQYIRIMGDRDTVTIDELASGSGHSREEVIKDLKVMIKDGLFASGAYLDEHETALMTSHEAYSQYQQTMAAYRQRQEEEQQQMRRAAEREMAAGNEETRTILKEGREFIDHIHQCNEQIPGKEMTEKLTKLEMLVDRIFGQVALHPESAPDLHRMMSYYLPITRKLVDAYVELDQQGFAGENMLKTKQEIEMSLDTINGAFEAFLDSFYQDQAWDISSDISALRTMMARDGLVGNNNFSQASQPGAQSSGSQAPQPATLEFGNQSAPAQPENAGSAQTPGGDFAGTRQVAKDLKTPTLTFGGAAAAVMEEEEGQ